MEPSPEGIGGWLILPLLGLFLTPFIIAFTLLSTFVPLFTSGAWANLTTPGRAAYHPLWAPLLIQDMVGNVAIAVAAIVLAVLFLKRSRLLPKAMVLYFAAVFVFLAGDLVAVQFIPAAAKADQSKMAFSVARSALVACIWIPYFLVSKRVKATFGDGGRGVAAASVAADRPRAEALHSAEGPADGNSPC